MLIGKKNREENTCPRYCCYASDYASIECISWLDNIVRPLRPRNRYVCINCRLMSLLELLSFAKDEHNASYLKSIEDLDEIEYRLLYFNRVVFLRKSLL